MRAAIFNEVGKEVIDIYDDVEVADPGPGEVRLKLHAAGVCHSDLSAMNGTLPQPAPAVLGHEGAGEIIEVGPGVDQVAVGDRVIVAWTPPCGRCAACLRGEANLCVDIFFNIAGAAKFAGGSPIFGFAGTGTFAEEMVLPQQGVVKIPDDVPYEIGALIGCGVTTGVGAALNTAKVKPGSSVVVFGAGGVGIAAIQGARIVGAAEIVAVDMVDSKLKTAQRFGATHGVKPDDLSAVNAEINGPAGGFDYAIECIGLPLTIRAAYDAVRRGGTAVIVGAGSAEKNVEFNCFELFFMEKKLLGSYYGSADVRTEFSRLIRLWKSGRLDLEGMISSRMDLSKAQDAFDAMKKGEIIRQILTF